jgi:hypothetical protein
MSVKLGHLTVVRGLHDCLVCVVPCGECMGPHRYGCCEMS